MIGNTKSGISSRLAVVHSFYRSSSPSGENSTVMDQVSQLRRLGFEVELFSVESEHHPSLIRQIELGANVTLGGGKNPSTAIDLFKPDLVLVHNLFPNFATSWMLDFKYPVLQFIHNYRFVCAAGTLSLRGQQCQLCPTRGSYHAVVNRCYKNSYLKSIPLALATSVPLARQTQLKGPDKLVFVSESLRRRYIGFGLSRDKTTTLPNFSFGRSPSKHQGDYWIFSGRLDPEKGIMELISSWPDTEKLVILGSGSLEKDVARVAQLRPEIRFLGYRQRLEAQALLAGSRGLMLTSTWEEGNPVVALEALSASVPIVCKASVNISAEISEFRAGTVFSRFEQLDGALAGVTDESRVGAYNLWKERYSPEAWSAGFLRIAGEWLSGAKLK